MPYPPPYPPRDSGHMELAGDPTQYPALVAALERCHHSGELMTISNPLEALAFGHWRVTTFRRWWATFFIATLDLVVVPLEAPPHE